MPVHFPDKVLVAVIRPEASRWVLVVDPASLQLVTVLSVNRPRHRGIAWWYRHRCWSWFRLCPRYGSFYHGRWCWMIQFRWPGSQPHQSGDRWRHGSQCASRRLCSAGCRSAGDTA